MKSLQVLLVLAALLLFSVVPIETKVVTSIAECSQFFLQQTPPRIPGLLEHGRILDQNRYKTICQNFLESTETFVTLYDIKNKIPVFSAAKYNGSTGRRPKDPPWLPEPELEDNNGNMIPVEKGCSYVNQAARSDYRQKPPNRYDRGHLLPSSYGHPELMKICTFSLTNIVPQEETFNKGSWSRMESCVKCVMDEYCKNNNYEKEAYVIIGAQPSDGRLLNEKINIPSMLWSAFCCYSHDQKRWLASAHWGENIGEDKTKDIYMQTKTLAELYDKLGRPFDVFPVTKCPLSTTVAEFYPNLNLKPNLKCKCPPTLS